MGLIGAQPALPTDLGGVGGGLRRLCAAAAEALSARGVGLSIVARDELRAVSIGSDLGTEQLEDLQFLLGEGPCLDSLAARRPVLIPELDEPATRRWPGYIPAVHELGIRAVFAFPLQVGAVRLGALDVFRSSAGPLSAAELRAALIFAEAATTLLLNGQENAVDGTAGGLEDQFAHGAEVYQAQGMVMAQLGVSLIEALTRIRAYTFAENRPLHDVATDIVHGRLHLDP